MRKGMLFMLSCLLIILGGCGASVAKEHKPDRVGKKQTVIKFHDPIFEETVRTMLNKPKGKITQNDVNSIKDFEGTQDILSYQDLKYLKNLNSLQLPSGAEDLESLSKLKHLKILNVSPDKEHAKIYTDLIPKLKSLTSLWIVRSELGGNYDFLNQLGQLKELHISGDNELKAVPSWPNLKGLTILQFASNQINDINNIKQYSALKTLNMEYNRITDLKPLANLSQLEGLNLNNNKIVDISPLSSLTKLQGISLEHNQIIDISPLEKLNDLKEIDLVSNKISNASPVSKMKGISKLEIYDNPLSSQSIDLLKKLKEQNKSIFYKNEHA